MSFEKMVSRLEEIAAQLDGGDVELDVALKLFEEGVELVRVAATELRAAEGTVKVLTEKLDGSFELADFQS